jgi:Sec-independent protein translocase protein TatA/GNAT superfamily N-acetyltransferase
VFGISFEELVVLAILAFILFGPQKLPEYAATLGRFMAKIRQASSEVTQQYQNPFQYPPEPTPSPAPESTCPYCQQKVALDFTFCPKCGHRLREELFNPPPQPSPLPQQSEPAQPPQPPSASEAARPSEPAPTSEPVQTAYPLIRPLRDDELAMALTIINQAAQAYKEVIPADCWHEPYMPEEELRAEIAAGVNFLSYEAEGRLLGVMGRQDLHDVTLIRHAYVSPEAQRQGVGARLLAYLLEEIPGPVLVGTWAAAWWAIRFYEKHGFKLVSQVEKDRLLNIYWTISPRQVETSVVLADPKWLALQAHA